LNEKLTIKNFGPISNAIIHLKRVNVIIGGQSTGKSTIAKLIDIFKSEDFLISKTTIDKIDIFNTYGLGSHFNPSSYLLYESAEYKIKFSEGKFNITLSKKLTDIFNQRSQVSLLISNIKKAATYFPTERIFISSLPSIASSRENRFLALPDYIMDFRLEFESSRNQNNHIKIDFLNVEFQHNKKSKKDFVSIGDKKIPLQEAASGIQSLIPLYVVLEKQTSSGDLEGIFLIEEPETNLFPVVQHELVKYITLKCLKFDDSFLLTTHSPYILSSLNNLMYAYQVGTKHKNEVSKIIEEKYWINPSEVNAYMLNFNEEENGTVLESITDKEGLIKVNKIDGISKALNDEFNKIMNIELNIKDEATN